MRFEDYKILSLEQCDRLRKKFYGGRSLLRHTLRASRKAVLSLAVLSTAAVWSTPVTAQPHETPASPEQQAQDGHDIQNYMNDAPVDIGIQKIFRTALGSTVSSKDMGQTCSKGRFSICRTN